MVTRAQDVRSIGAEKPCLPTAGRTGVIAAAEWLKKKNANRALFAIGDVTAFALSHLLARLAVQYWPGVPRASLTPADYWFFYLPFLLAVLYLLDRNHCRDLRRPEKELELTLKGVSFAFLLLICANFVVFKAAVFSRYLMLAWYILALVLVVVFRFSVRQFYGALWRHGLARRRTLLLGAVDRLLEFHSRLAIQRYGAYDIVGVLADGSVSSLPWEPSIPVLGTLSQWPQVAREKVIEQIVVCLPHTSEESHRVISDILRGCLPIGIDVQVFSDLFASRRFNYELDEFSGFFRFFSAAAWGKHLQVTAKKVVDVVAGIVGSAITLLLLPSLALLIKLEDGGPIFYHSEFIDPSGDLRYYRKFRSMRTDAAEILERDPVLKAKFEEKQKLVDDPRVTRVGRILRKYSIDELPEFFSVFTGRLSLVGPRTICRKEVHRYGDRLPKLLTAKPGLTGFWQVMGRQLTTYDERIQMDMFYIDHWSIWLDLWIVAKTVWKVLRAEGAY
jgi:exopolysaccharide biosynthesis polyprenyl glycosylphosphotransferase